MVTLCPSLHDQCVWLTTQWDGTAICARWNVPLVRVEYGWFRYWLRCSRCEEEREDR